MLKSKKRKEYFTILLRGKVVLYDWFLHSANSQLHRIQNSFSFHHHQAQCIYMYIQSYTQGVRVLRWNKKKSDARCNTLKISFLKNLTWYNRNWINFIINENWEEGMQIYVWGYGNDYTFLICMCMELVWGMRNWGNQGFITSN